jgi:hypothetical protein
MTTGAADVRTEPSPAGLEEPEARSVRRTDMPRLLTRAILAATVPLALSAFLATGAGASCAGPRLQVSSGIVAPGASVSVRGTSFGTDCNDTGQDGPPLGDAAHDADVVFVQGTTRSVLGSVDADDDYVVDFAVTVPRSAEPGPASFEVAGARIPIWIDGAIVPADVSVPATSAVAQYPHGHRVAVSDLPWGVVAVGGVVAGGAAVIGFQGMRRRRQDRRF